MAINLLLCSSCGTRNVLGRASCLSCGNILKDHDQELMEPSTLAIVKRNWFQVGTLSVLSLIAFSLFYHFVIDGRDVQRTAMAKAALVNGAAENVNASETPIEEGPALTQQREKAARDFEQAQAEFERQVRDDHARAKALQDQEDSAREARKRELDSKLALGRCFVRVQAQFNDHWNHNCAIQGRPEGCTLHSSVGSILEQNHRAARDECYRLYPVRAEP